MDIGQLLPGYNYSFAVVAVRSIETDLAESEENFIPGYTGMVYVLFLAFLL